MKMKNRLSCCVLVLAAITTVTELQGIPGAGFNFQGLFPQRPQIPGIPSFPDISSQTFCDLSVPELFTDPSIVDIPPDAFPAAAANRALQNAPAAAAYREGAHEQAVSRDAARERARAEGRARKKRQTKQMSFLAPTIKTPLCVTQEKRLQAVISKGQLCYTFPEDDIKFFACQSSTASVPNAFPGINQYICSPENYAFTSFHVFCPDSVAEPFRFHTVFIPLNCCGRHHFCDFKPYAAMNGPRLY